MFVRIHFVLFLFLLSGASTSFLTPVRTASKEAVSRLIQSSRQEPLDISPSFSPLLRVMKPDDPTCTSDYPLERALGLSGTGFGAVEDQFTIDSSNLFLKVELGLDEKEIEESAAETLKFFKKDFGIDATDAVRDDATGIYNSTSTNLALFPIVFDFPLVKVSDSSKLVICPNSTAIMGGWVAEVDNPTLSGPFSGGQNVTISGETCLFVLYIIFAPGSKFSTKIEWKSTFPVAGNTGAVPLVGDMKFVNDFHEAASGTISGVGIEQIQPDPALIIRLLLEWPGRQTKPDME